MTSTLASTSTSTTSGTGTATGPGVDAAERRPRPVVWRTGVVAGLVAAAATAGIAAVADALDVSLAVEAGGEAIPILGFANLTFACALIGTALAAVLARRARRPQQTFTRATIALTALSVVPDLTTVHTGAATVVTLVLTHLVAAAIVVPALRRRLA